MKPSRIIATIVALVFVVQSSTFGQQKISTKTETIWGLHTTTYETPQGKIKVNLPDDMAVGDTISGTVIEEPTGQTEDERRMSTDELNGYVLELENEKTPVTQRFLKRTIPATLTGGMTLLILRDSKGKEVARTQVPIRPAPLPMGRPASPASGDYRLPRIGQAGRPIQIAGPFDGDLANTAISLGGQDVQKLAESPRKLIAESPRAMVGRTQIRVMEGSAVVTGEFNNLGVVLTAPKTSLLRNETTTVTAKVDGLQGLPPDAYPLPFEMTNLTPEVISFAERGDQSIAQPIPYSAVTAEGSYTFTTSIRGIQPGGFQILATLQEKQCECQCKVTIGDGIKEEDGGHRHRDVDPKKTPPTYEFTAKAMPVCKGGAEAEPKETTYDWTYTPPAAGPSIAPATGPKTTLTYSRKDEGGGQLTVSATVPYKCGKEKKSAQCTDTISIEEDKVEGGGDCVCELGRIKIINVGLAQAEVAAFATVIKQIRKYRVEGPKLDCGDKECKPQLLYDWAQPVVQNGQKVRGGGQADNYVILQANATPMSFDIRVVVTLICQKQGAEKPSCRNTRSGRLAGKVDIEGVPKVVKPVERK